MSITTTTIKVNPIVSALLGAGIVVNNVAEMQRWVNGLSVVPNCNSACIVLFLEYVQEVVKRETATPTLGDAIVQQLMLAVEEVAAEIEVAASMLPDTYELYGQYLSLQPDEEWDWEECYVGNVVATEQQLKAVCWRPTSQTYIY